jgi:dTDP-4-dehydrorhamnose reductase
MSRSSGIDILSQDRKMLEILIGKSFLITGGNGMLARAFQSQLKQIVPSATVYCPSKAQLDVRWLGAFSPYHRLRPDYIVHCAALVNADYCEDHSEEAAESILRGTQHVVEFALQCGAKLLYPQSFLIYDNVDSLINEQTIPRPLCTYGQLKLEAERLVLDSSAKALSVRMGGFFGGESADNNFIGKITHHLAKLIYQGMPSIEIGNRVWQPTYTNDLAANCLLLLAADCEGIYCMASQGSASFHELTLEIARQLDIAHRIDIHCIDAAILSTKERARRPLSAIMCNQRLQVENFDRQRSWKISLAEYLDQPFFKDMFQ